MKSRPDPAPTSGGRGLGRLAQDPQVKKWAKRITGNPQARPHDLDEAQLRFIAIELAKRRGETVNETHFDRALAATRPLLAVPDVTDPVADLDLILRQPELEEFWARWQRPARKQGSRGPQAADSAVKALMMVMAVPGLTTHASHAHTLLERIPALAPVFQELGLRAAKRAGVEAPPDFDPLSYAGATRHRREVAASCSQLAMQSNIAMLRELRQILGDRVGKVWLVDGCAVPAWAPQVSSRGSDSVEKALRRYAPDAGFRAIGYVGNGKTELDALDGETMRSAVKAARTKSWRGYYLMVLVDQATGLPGVWTLIDAKEQETTALTPLLSQLHALWPDVGAEIVAGDSAFDTDACCRLLEVDYGIHPVFRLHDARGRDVPRGTVRGDRLLALDEQGRLICAAHGRGLDYETLDRPSRQGLRAGESSDERAFRYRVACKHDRDAAGRLLSPCRRLSLPASLDWSKLTHFPHHSDGRPDLYATRQVLLSARLGQVESVFNALKGGYKLGGTGASRTRIRELDVHEALISLAFLGRTALTLADQRQRQGLAPVSRPGAATKSRPWRPTKAPASQSLTTGSAVSAEAGKPAATRVDVARADEATPLRTPSPVAVSSTGPAGVRVRWRQDVS